MAGDGVGDGKVQRKVFDVTGVVFELELEALVNGCILTEKGLNTYQTLIQPFV